MHVGEGVHAPHGPLDAREEVLGRPTLGAVRPDPRVEGLEGRVQILLCGPGRRVDVALVARRGLVVRGPLAPEDGRLHRLRVLRPEHHFQSRRDGRLVARGGLRRQRVRDGVDVAEHPFQGVLGEPICVVRREGHYGILVLWVSAEVYA